MRDPFDDFHPADHEPVIPRIPLPHQRPPSEPRTLLPRQPDQEDRNT